MDADRAQALAEQLHAGVYEEDGSPVLLHVGRVVGATPAEARAVAWLHEALESAAVTEQELLAQGVTTDELRALRLLARGEDSGSDSVYLAHVALIARAAGHSGHLARMVKVADLEDRREHPRVRPNGWSPPYERGLQRLHEAIGRVTGEVGTGTASGGRAGAPADDGDVRTGRRHVADERVDLGSGARSRHDGQRPAVGDRARGAGMGKSFGRW